MADTILKFFRRGTGFESVFGRRLHASRYEVCGFTTAGTASRRPIPHFALCREYQQQASILVGTLHRSTVHLVLLTRTRMGGPRPPSAEWAGLVPCRQLRGGLDLFRNGTLLAPSPTSSRATPAECPHCGTSAVKARAPGHSRDASSVASCCMVCQSSRSRVPTGMRGVGAKKFAFRLAELRRREGTS